LLDGIVCVCEYSGIIKHAVVRYKFYNKSSYYRTFAGLLADSVKKMTCGSKFDIIISVPLHRVKRRNRGYNQSLLISRVLSRKLGVPEGSKYLSRARNTDSQSLLSGEKRHINVLNAFRVDYADKVVGKDILLVDDVLTTGSTLNECCRVLKAAGAGRVVAAVIASGRKF
jgi:ComF family protein